MVRSIVLAAILVFSVVLASEAFALTRHFSLHRTMYHSAEGSNHVYILNENVSDPIRPRTTNCVWHEARGTYRTSGKSGIVFGGDEYCIPLIKALEGRWSEGPRTVKKRSTHTAEFWSETCTIEDEELPQEFQTNEYRALLASRAEAEHIAKEKALAQAARDAEIVAEREERKKQVEAEVAAAVKVKDRQIQRERAAAAEHMKIMIQTVQTAKEDEIQALKSAMRDVCFPAETPINISLENLKSFSNTLPISSVKAGDLVLSCAIHLSGRPCESRVVNRVFVTDVERLVVLHFNGAQIRVTPNHPFFSPEKSIWVAAEDLVIGDRLLTVAGDLAEVDDIQEQEGEFKVYNLEVEVNQNYYANGVLVHNCNKSGISVPDIFSK